MECRAVTSCRVEGTWLLVQEPMDTSKRPSKTGSQAMSQVPAKVALSPGDSPRWLLDTSSMYCSTFLAFLHSWPGMGVFPGLRPSILLMGKHLSRLI